MKSPYRQFLRRGLVGLPLVIVAAWLMPRFFSAESHRRRVEAGLQQALRRPVTFGALEFRVLWRPGLSNENAVVREDPAFGSEPFARADRIDCALRWRNLLSSRIDCASLTLDHATFNLVRNARGEWNVENLLSKTTVASDAISERPAHRAPNFAPSLDVYAEDGRLNFKIGKDKKPLAITDVKGRIHFEPARGFIAYELEGRPVRTDLSFPTPGGSPPTPGVLQLTGEWRPGRNLEGPIQARLRTTKSRLYDWIPLLTGHNREIYGVLDTAAEIKGSLQDLKVEGDGEIRQLHRWELPPPSNSTPLQLHYRGELNRRLGRARIEEISGSFGDSHFHLAGSVENVLTAPRLDLIAGLDRSQLDDLLALARRFWGDSPGFGISGRIDGILVIQGSLAAQRYGGIFTTREVKLDTAQGAFPIGEATLRIDSRGIQLSPARIGLAPGVEAILEAAVYSPARSGSAESLKPAKGRHPELRANQHASPVLLASQDPGREGFFHYQVSLSGKEIPLRSLLRLSRAAGKAGFQNIRIEQGTGSGNLRITGRVWPLQRPQIEGRFQVHEVQLSVPGLTEPLLIPHAQLQVDDNRIQLAPLVAEIGGNSFSGRVEHDGDSRQPWTFNLRADTLSLEQASQWFESLGGAAHPSLLDRIPALWSFDSRRNAVVKLFRAINVKGVLSAPAVTYRDLTLADFRTAIAISNRVVRLPRATFRSGAGRGEGRLEIDMTGYPARVAGAVRLDQANVQAIARRLPLPLKGVQGLVSGSAQFETTGLNRDVMSSNLHALGTLKLHDLTFGQFDPLEILARETGSGWIEPARGVSAVRNAAWTLEVRDRRVFLVRVTAELSGAKLRLTGNYSFDGNFDLGVHCDFSRLTRRWQTTGNLGAVIPTGASGSLPGGPHGASGESTAFSPITDLHVSGPLDKLTVLPALEISHSTR